MPVVYLHSAFGDSILNVALLLRVLKSSVKGDVICMSVEKGELINIVN